MATVTTTGAITTRERLEVGFQIIQTILRKRRETGSPSLGWAIERAIVHRELNELEQDLLLNPPPGALECRQPQPAPRKRAFFRKEKGS